MLGRNVNERIIENLIRNGCEGKTDDIAKVTAQIAGDYTAEIVRRLAVYGYTEEYVKLYVFGGGGCLLKHYSSIAGKKCKWRPTSAAFAELIGRDAERAATPLF